MKDFDVQNGFEAWWLREGQSMAPKCEDGESVRFLCRIAWGNGSSSAMEFASRMLLETSEMTYIKKPE